MIIATSAPAVNPTTFLPTVAPFIVSPNTTATPAQRFSPLPNLFVDVILPQLTGNAVKVYNYLQRHADRKTARVVRSLDEIAAGCGIGRATAQRAAQQLAALGVVATKARYGYDGTAQRAARVRNAYTLTAPDVWQMAVPVEVSRVAENDNAPVQNNAKSAENDNAITNAFSNAHNSNDKQAARGENSCVMGNPITAAAAAHSVNETATAIPTSTCGTSHNAEIVGSSELDEPQRALCAKLETIGVIRTVAHALVQSHDGAAIETQIDALPGRNPKAPARMLVKAIRENWELPTPAQSGNGGDNYDHTPRPPRPRMSDEQRARIDECRERAAQMIVPTLDERWQRQAAACEQGGETLVVWCEREFGGRMKTLVRELARPH